MERVRLAGQQKLVFSSLTMNTDDWITFCAMMCHCEEVMKMKKVATDDDKFCYELLRKHRPTEAETEAGKLM